MALPVSPIVSYSGLALVAGLGIPVMAAINGTLGARLGSPVLATFILFLGGLGIAMIALFIVGFPAPGARQNFHPGLLTGGLFVAFYVLSITWLVPRFGVGNAVFFVLLGQIISSVVIDHFGLFGAPRISISSARVLGIVLMTVGVLLAKRPI